jgi:hypothetical protein
MWQTVRSAQLAPTNWAGRCLVALFLVTGGSLPSGNGQSVVSPRFEDFLVSNVYRGATKPPDFGNRDRYQGTDLRCFGGDPMDYANKQVNFAGHFVISTCTCGSGCHYLFMWDAVSGKFYHHVPPGAINVGPYAMRGVQPPGIVTRASSISRTAAFSSWRAASTTAAIALRDTTGGPEKNSS